MRIQFLQRLALLTVGAMWMSTSPLLAQAQSEATRTPTLIQPNDRLTIDIYKNPDLSRMVTVQPDGLISIPLVQSIRAAGLTPAQLKVEMEKRLMEYLEVPTVTVIIDAIQSYRVYVIGKVQKPGIIMSERPITVLQALAMAGGFQEFSKKDQITIIRTTATPTGQGQLDTKFPFDFEKVVDTKQPLNISAQNIFLISGDIVNVP